MLACVILAGGLGTRMRPHTDRTPKTLLPVAGRPYADLQLEWLRSQGVEHVVYSVGFRGDLVRVHVGDGSAYGLRVDWVDEGDRLLGTAGALRLVVDSGLVREAFFVLYGDSYLRVDLRDVERAFLESGRPALMTVLRNDDAWDRSNAILAHGRVVLYDKNLGGNRPPQMRWIDYGLLAVRSEAIREAVPEGAASDLAGLMHDLSVSGRLAGYEARHRFYEIGSPEGLADLEAFLRGRHRQRST